mmetsp:Transcript_845/g.1510  ORF Transcript_845/g.1510 Transcript_845/m.1510 type:complete len:745 (-) Transcript_845:53-2287(-)
MRMKMRSTSRLKCYVVMLNIFSSLLFFFLSLSQPANAIDDFGGHNDTHQEGVLKNLQNFTERGDLLDDESTTSSSLRKEKKRRENAIGPVDRMRLSGLKELLSHLNFIDLQLDKIEANQSTSLSNFLRDEDNYRNFTLILSGLDVSTQLQIEKASMFFSETKCLSPPSGRNDVNIDEWMFYLARRAERFQQRREDVTMDQADDAVDDELFWEQFPINCVNETFTIPSWLGKFDWLNDLIVSVSNPVYVNSKGQIPESVGNLTKLTTFSLQGEVTGQIPKSFGKLQRLNNLMLNSNKLIGPIPEELGNCSRLYKLWLNDNQLTGSIPDTLANLTNLKSLHLQDNQLTGGLTPALAEMEQRMGKEFLLYGNPISEDAFKATLIATGSPLQGWEIALIVVAAGLAAATIAISVSWAVRRNRLLKAASRRKGQLEMGDFDDDGINTMFSINRKDLKLVKLVGRGTYGSVFEANWNTTPVAVKIMNVMDPQMHSREDSRRFIKTFEQEVEYLSQVNHKNIVKLYGYSLASPHIYIVQELMTHNLSEMTHAKDYVPDDIHILKIIENIAEGLSYLHPRIVHCDLKPQNILLNAAGVAKIADFGISKKKQGTFIQFTKHTHVPGSVIYMAPECFNAPEEVGEKCDVYSLAMIIWECYTGVEPWEELPSPISVVNAVAVQGRRPYIPEAIPPEVAKLIRKCWCTDYHMRPSCAEVAKLCHLMVEDIILQNSPSGTLEGKGKRDGKSSNGRTV